MIEDGIHQYWETAAGITNQLLPENSEELKGRGEENLIQSYLTYDADSDTSDQLFFHSLQSLNF